MSTWSDLKHNPRLKKIFDQRIKIVRLIREFFWSQGFVEAETPLALRFASQEPYLHFFPVMVTHATGDEYRFYLRTSPEFALKKLLAAGWNKVFEIGKCFRNHEDFGGTHNPEFTMIEWYRAPGTYQNFMDDMEELFKFVGKELLIETLRYKDKEIKVNQTWERMSMKEVWEKYVGVDLDNNLTIEQLSNTARGRGYSVGNKDSYEDIFFKIFLNEIESHLGIERPMFLYDYPAQMASLSRLCHHDPRYAERVECYIGGLEICNGFGELTDSDEQKRRLEVDRAVRHQLGKETWPVDEDFIAALKSGIPANLSFQPERSPVPYGTGRGVAEKSRLAKTSRDPSAALGMTDKAAGIALGVDRMILLFTGARDINEVIFQSVNDQLTINN